MNNTDIFTLGLNLQSPWELTSQNLDTNKVPFELHLSVSTQRGELFPCPECDKACPAHDFKEQSWRHLNFFQHHCYIKARVPRIRCPDHKVRQVQVPWARKGSGFTLLFEQAALTLVREMPVNATSRILEVTDKRLWRVIEYYVKKSLKKLDLSNLKAVGFDETAAKRKHRYVTVFIDMNKEDMPVIFATPGKGKATVKSFKAFASEHKADTNNLAEVVCDMSPAFQSAVQEEFPNANITVDWFHVVQLFTTAVDEVRKVERKQFDMPKSLRWAVLKNAEAQMSQDQKLALIELAEYDYDTARAWRVKEKLRWVRKAETMQGAKWRLTNFIKYTELEIGDEQNLYPVRKALATVKKHAERILQRWNSTYSNARMEGLNGLFQAARSRARGYRNTETFITMIYMLCSPVRDIMKST